MASRSMPNYILSARRTMLGSPEIAIRRARYLGLTMMLKVCAMTTDPHE
jgi:hypothetical protein